MSPPAGTAVVVTGWGMLSINNAKLPSQLQQLRVIIVDHEECNKKFKGQVTDRIICAGAPQGWKGVCSGDSGGPLVSNGTLVGVSSSAPSTCGKPGVPDGYSDVAILRDWVESAIQSA
mgnify:CR=1 FL=1